LRTLAAHPDMRARFGVAAAASAQRYDWSVAVRAHLELYGRVGGGAA
jgi:hypothetical protein